MRVINMQAFVMDNCNCGDWIEHWEKLSGNKATICHAKDCLKTAFIGTHVQTEKMKDLKWFTLK
jgi:hypothetical protein